MHPKAEPAPAHRNPAPRWALLLLAVFGLIIVPFALFGESIERGSVAVLLTLSEQPTLSAVLIVALLATDVVLPIPSSIVSTLAGALLGVTGGAAASWLGMTIGCLVGYGLGRTAGKGIIIRFIGPRELVRLEARAQRHGEWTLVVTRAVPVLAEASTVFAGMGAMRPRRFAAITGLANLGISLAYATVGAYAAELQSFFLALTGAVLLPLIATALFRWWR